MYIVILFIVCPHVGQARIAAPSGMSIADFVVRYWVSSPENFHVHNGCSPLAE
jgi:hypothetical protein